MDISDLLEFDESASNERLNAACDRINELYRFLMFADEFIQHKLSFGDPEESRTYKILKSVSELNVVYKEMKSLFMYVREDRPNSAADAKFALNECDSVFKKYEDKRSAA
jgi:hypothetical protein